MAGVYCVSEQKALISLVGLEFLSRHFHAIAKTFLETF